MMTIYEKLINKNVIVNNMKVIFFISFFFILTTSICSAEETSLKMDEFLLDKIKSLEKLQEDVDLLFAEYCHFNNYEDSRCREGENTSGDQNDGNDTENYENGETYYTIKNANLRSEPKIATNILITVPKGESVQAYARSKDDHEWYKVKYDSTPGYMHESLLSKNKPLIQPKEEIPSEDIEKFEDITQSDIKKEIEECTNNYETVWEEEYGVTKNDYNQKCACYWNGVKELITEEEEDYFNENKKFSEKLDKKLEVRWDNCDEKMFEIIDKRDEKEFLKERIKACKDDFDIDLNITWKENAKWCECYWENFVDNYNEREAEYFDKNEDFSDSFKNKLKKIDESCFHKVVGK